MPSAHPDMAPIDLSLAVNYLPAVACLAKTIIISATMALVRSEHAMAGFTGFALALNLDRVLTGERIFNGNAVLCMILFSWFLNHLRLDMPQGNAAGVIISLIWAFCSSCLLLEPRRLTALVPLESGPGIWGESGHAGPRPGHWRLRRLLPAAVNTALIGLIALTRAEPELGSFKIARSCIFSLLCVTWVYVVGVWQRCIPSQQAVYTQNLLSRFCPVLFLAPVLAVLFVMSSVFWLIHLYIELHAGGAERLGLCQCPTLWAAFRSREPSQEVPLTAEGPEYEEPYSSSYPDGGQEPYSHRGGFIGDNHGCADAAESMGAIQEEEADEDLEACFRAACKNRMQGQGAV
jgi:hypothetical protein